LLYHGIGSTVPHDAYGMSVPEHVFCDQIRWLREESGHAIVRLDEGYADFQRGGSNGTAVAVTFDDGLRDVLTTAAPILARYDIPFTAFVVGGYVDEPPEPVLYLDRAAVRELASMPGATIGVHGFTHRPLSRLSSDDVDDELKRCRDVLRDCVGTSPFALSYPHGAVNRRVAARASAAGFAVGATSLTGVNRTGVDPLRLRRTEIVAADGLAEFHGKVRGDYDWYGVRQRLYWPVPQP
jgi:peptidoglycan/xylan/chitin deacetylase (PgdA/CDA1 family)